MVAGLFAYRDTTPARDLAALAYLDGEIQRPRRSPFCLLGTALVALGMVILPLIYLAPLAAVSWVVCFHATENVGILNASGGGFQGRLTAYFEGNDLVLTIGMPLMSGPTLRQLTGVLAHERGELLVGLDPLPLPEDNEPGTDATSIPDTPPHPPAPSSRSDSSPPATP